MKSSRSLGVQIPMLVLGVGILLVAAFLSISYSYHKAAFQQSSAQRLGSSGPYLANVTKRLLWLEDEEGMDIEMRSLHQIPEIHLVVIVDDANTIMYASDEKLLGVDIESTELAMAADLIAATGTTNREIVEQFDGHQQVVGVYAYPKSSESSTTNNSAATHLVVSINMDEAYESLHAALWSQGLASVLCLLLIAALFWYVFDRLVMLPTRKIVKTTRTLAEGDLTARTRLSSANELGEISATLDSLAFFYSEQIEAQQTHRQLSVIVNEMVDEVFVSNAHTHEIINANKAAHANLGYGKDELIGISAWEFVSGNERSGLDAMLQPLIEGEVSHLHCECVHLRKDGSTYPVRARMQFMAHQQPPVVVTIAQNLTELKTHEESARLRERAMAAVGEGVIITDVSDGARRIVYANQAMCDMSGYAAQELVEQHPEVLFKAQANESGTIAINEAVAQGDSVQLQMNTTRKDGSCYITELSLSPVTNPNGELTHYIGIHRDVTQKLETDKKLHQAQRIEAIGHLSGGLAHDFNNLLSVIVGNLELLRAGTQEQTQINRIESAENAAHMGAHLTNRLLTFASQKQLAPVVTNVNDTVRNAVVLLAPTIGESITLEEKLDSDLWNVLTDPGEIETAVINLAINARDAMPQGGRITIKTKNIVVDGLSANANPEIKPGDYVRLCVMDNGPGISHSIKDRIFEPFFTTKPDGSGLGLASVFGFAKQSDGFVKVQSSEGDGTTVSVYLPRHLQDNSNIQSPSEADEKSADSLTACRILVVEDKDMVRQLTVTQLESLGLEVLQVGSGVEAIELLESGVGLDVVLTDVVMPGGVCGYDVAEWVQAHRPQCRILLTSGYNALFERESSEGTSDLPVLLKPYRLHELRDALHDVMKDSDEKMPTGEKSSG